VSAEAAFVSQIAKIKRRVVMRAGGRILLHASVFFLGLHTIRFILLQAGFTDHLFNGVWLVFSVGISLSAAMTIGLATRTSLLNVLVDIDRRMNLKDRLSTAYEYLKFKKKSEFTELLIKDATAGLGRLTGRQLLPAGLSFLHWAAIFLLITNIALYALLGPASDFKSAHADLKIIEQAGTVLRNYTISRSASQAGPQTGRNKVYTRKLEQLGNQFHDRTKTFDQQLQALTGLLEEVQAEQTRLAAELGTQLNAAGIEAVPIQKNPGLDRLSLSQLEKLKAILDNRPNQQTPAGITEMLESLQELDGMDKLLTRMLGDIERDRSDAAESAGPAGNALHQSQTDAAPDITAANQNRPENEEQFSNPNRSGLDRGLRPGSGPLQKKERDFQEEMDPQREYSSSAGSAKSGAGKEASYEIDKTPGLARQDKTASAPMKNYLVHIRTLTDIGETRLEEEDIVRAYRQEVESILQKEDMPANYREYIKNYFLAIGVNTKENADESK
jgi:hypothetical protein